MKGAIAYGFQTTSEGQRAQVRTPHERLVSDADNRAGDRHRRQTGAIDKSAFANMGYTGGNGDPINRIIAPGGILPSPFAVVRIILHSTFAGDGQTGAAQCPGAIAGIAAGGADRDGTGRHQSQQQHQRQQHRNGLFHNNSSSREVVNFNIIPQTNKKGKQVQENTPKAAGKIAVFVAGKPLCKKVGEISLFLLVPARKMWYANSVFCKEG